MKLKILRKLYPLIVLLTNHEKFYPKLQRILKDKVGNKLGNSVTYNLLSNKGSDSGEMILRFLTSPENINGKIINAFTMLNNN